MTCVVCGGTAAAPVYDGLLRRCERCGHVWAPVDDGSLPALYARDYFHGVEYRDYAADREILQHNFDARLRVLGRFTDRRHHRLLEIGCAYGFFLERAQQRFDRVTGVDISEAAVAEARRRGLDAMVGDLPALGWQDEVDVVCAWDTIEHLARPDAHVAAAAAALVSGGLLALTTGDIGSLNARLRGSRWRLIHPPTHVHYFSRATLTRLLERHGLEVVHVEYPGVSRSVANVLHNLTAGSKISGLADRLARSFAGRIMMSVNLYDVMFVIARKHP